MRRGWSFSETAEWAVGAMLALAVVSVIFALWQHHRQHRLPPAEAETDF